MIFIKLMITWAFIVTSIWVFADAWSECTRKSLSRWIAVGWFAGCIGAWVPAFLFYIYQRGKLEHSVKGVGDWVYVAAFVIFLLTLYCIYYCVSNP